jgi:DNA-binding NtrC family response regulator
MPTADVLHRASLLLSCGVRSCSRAALAAFRGTGVDDEKVISRTLATILNFSGFRAESFDRPEKAIAAAVDLAPDLLITDEVMARMSGVELAIHFRKLHPRCKVLLFSGQSKTSDLLEQARAQGYDFEVIAKPIHPNVLIKRVRIATADPHTLTARSQRWRSRFHISTGISSLIG